MYPVLFHIGPVTLYSYGVMMALAFIAGLLILQWYLPKRGIDRVWALDLVLAGAIGGLVGARVLYVTSFWSEFSDAWWHVFELWRGGMVFYGGAIGGTIAVVAYALWRKIPLAVVADGGALVLPLGSAIGRIGCFFNGCCAGIATDSALGCTFPGHTEPVLPTQLFDAAANFAVFGLILWVVTRPRVRPGVAWWLYVMLYGVSRFTVEIWRVNPRGLAGLSQAQLISVAMFAIGLAGLAWMRARGGWTVPDAQAGEAGGPGEKGAS